MEWVFVFVLRLTIPLLMFRYPLRGALLSILADNIDWHILRFFSPTITNAAYQQYDKLLDMYYLSIECYLLLSWKERVARFTGLGLFLYRSIGILLFEITNLRFLLFIFPNLFEVFYIFYLVYKRVTKQLFSFTKLPILFALIPLIIAKILFEYSLHIKLHVPLEGLDKEIFTSIISFSTHNTLLLMYVTFLAALLIFVRRLLRI